ncbi:MAG: tRNA dihydrouridine(20/20a) synthase DusA [Bdellovibrionales bacterium]
MNKEVNHFNKPHVSIAPMMAWTDKHCRFFHRLISPNSILYTEMVTTGALIHGDQERHLAYNEQEHPVALQLGGNDPKDLAFSAKLGEKYGYDEINLNCGCPSDRVQNGAFGACLMNDPQLVASCVSAMREAVDVPVTVKCRIGIDNSDDYEFLETFVTTVADSGCDTFIIHARKAWLQGLSPKENREIPPLKYEVVQRIKDTYPHLNIILNGGIKDIQSVQDHLEHFDGVMIGREAYQNPWILSEIERVIFNHDSLSRIDVAHKIQTYINENEYQPQNVTRHIMGLFKGQAGGRLWRQFLSENSQAENNILLALEKMANN